ncbi:MAG: sensor histidine kinase [Myxococcales bacterium]|nr:sensor histidine kinase [Myxococcales bacterium]
MCRLQSVGAKVAHELKNPLASVKGLVQLLARAPAEGKARERLDVMQSEIARMEAILVEYLSFARPLEDLRPQAIALDAIVTDAAAVVSGRAEHARLALTVDAAPVALTADPRRLKEALLNLLANAIEATPAGGTITVRTRPAADGGGVIEVVDSGRGIKPDDLARLGTSFFTTREGGTGLGVVLASSVVAQHGGTIHYDSTVGQGTSVIVRLPATPGAAPAAQTGGRAA